MRGRHPRPACAKPASAKAGKIVQLHTKESSQEGEAGTKSFREPELDGGMGEPCILYNLQKFQHDSTAAQFSTFRSMDLQMFRYIAFE